MKIFLAIAGLVLATLLITHIVSGLTYNKVSQGYMVGNVVSYDCVGEGDYPCIYTIISNGNKYRLKAHKGMYAGQVSKENKIILYERIQKGFTDTYYLQ